MKERARRHRRPPTLAQLRARAERYLRERWEWPRNFCEYRTVYGLAGPGGVIRYVGCCKSPEKRLRQHLAAARKGTGQPVHQWIRSVLDAGGEVSLVVLNRLGGEHLEWRVIAARSRLAAAAGDPLFNVHHNEALLEEAVARNVAAREERQRASRARRLAKREARMVHHGVAIGGEVAASVEVR